MLRLLSKSVCSLAFLFISFATKAQTNQALRPSFTTTNPNVSSATPFSATVEAVADSSIRIIIDNPQQKLLNLRITHMVTGIVKDTMINTERYACVYHFGSADDGTYQVIVRAGKKKIRKTILLRTETIPVRTLNVE